jgi:hypothetical protein
MPISAHDVVQEMTEFSQFMQALMDSGTSPEQLEATRAAMVRSIASKVNIMQTISFGDAALITGAIGTLAADGWVSADQQGLLTTSLVTRMQDATTGPLADAATRRAPQTCVRPDVYLTAGDWDWLNASAAVQANISYLRDRMHAIGLVCPSEKTLKVLTALVLCTAGQTELPGEQKFDIFKQVKAIFASGRPGTTGLPHLINFPDSPQSLDRRLFHNAYGDTTGPAAGITPIEYHIAALARTIPARISNVQVRGHFIGARGGHSTPDPAVALQQTLMMAIQSLGGHRGGGMPRISYLGNRSSSQASLADSPPSTPRPQQRMALEDRGHAEHIQRTPVQPLPSLPSLHPAPHAEVSETSSITASISASVAAALASPRVDGDELARMQKLAAEAGAAAVAKAGADQAEARSQAKLAASKKKAPEAKAKDTAASGMKRPAAYMEKPASKSAASTSKPVKQPAVVPPKGGKLRVEWSRGQVVCTADRSIGGQTQKFFKFVQHGGVEGARAAATKWLR